MCKNDGQCPHCNSVFMALATAPVHEQAHFQTARHAADMRALSARTTTEPPEPPSLSAAVGGKPVDYPPTYIFGRPEPRPLVTATGVPEMPSLTDAIVSARKGGRR